MATPASRGLKTKAATTRPTRVMGFCTAVAKPETAYWTLLTSLARRLTCSPVGVVWW